MKPPTLVREAGQGRRDVVVGVLVLAAAGLLLSLLSPGTAGQWSTFVLTSRRGGVTIAAPDLVLQGIVSDMQCRGLGLPGGLVSPLTN